MFTDHAAKFEQHTAKEKHFESGGLCKCAQNTVIDISKAKLPEHSIVFENYSVYSGLLNIYFEERPNYFWLHQKRFWLDTGQWKHHIFSRKENSFFYFM